MFQNRLHQAFIQWNVRIVHTTRGGLSMTDGMMRCLQGWRAHIGPAELKIQGSDVPFPVK